MNKYVIERDIPDIGLAGKKEMQEGARASQAALQELGTKIQWLESFVTKDKIYCIYLAEDEDVIHRHAEMSGFPATRVSRVRGILDLTAARAN